MIAVTGEPNKRSLRDCVHASRAVEHVKGEDVSGEPAKVIAGHRPSWHEIFLCPQRKERPGKWLGENGS